MENRLGLKVAAIAVLSIALLVGLMWIGSMVTERQQRRDMVVHDIAESSSNAQTIKGPVLVVPYVKTVRIWKEDSSAGNRRIEERQIPGEIRFFLPEGIQVEWPGTHRAAQARYL